MNVMYSNFRWYPKYTQYMFYINNGEFKCSCNNSKRPWIQLEDTEPLCLYHILNDNFIDTSMEQSWEITAVKTFLNELCM